MGYQNLYPRQGCWGTWRCPREAGGRPRARPSAGGRGETPGSRESGAEKVESPVPPAGGRRARKKVGGGRGPHGRGGAPR